VAAMASAEERGVQNAPRIGDDGGTGTGHERIRRHGAAHANAASVELSANTVGRRLNLL